MNMNKKDKYEDMYEMPHHTSPTRPRMSLRSRAAQFAPFAALTGHDAAIAETARLTDNKIDLDESTVSLLNEKLRILIRDIDKRNEVSVTYFRPDSKKRGGKYITVKGIVKKLDQIEGKLVFEDGQEIPLNNILEIEGKEI